MRIVEIDHEGQLMNGGDELQSAVDWPNQDSSVCADEDIDI